MLPSLNRRALIRTLVIALSIAAGAALYTVWQIKQDVDAVAARFTLDPGPQSTLIYDSKDRLISALYKEHRVPVTLEEMSDPPLLRSSRHRRAAHRRRADCEPPPWPHRRGWQHDYAAIRPRGLPRSLAHLCAQGS